MRRNKENKEKRRLLARGRCKKLSKEQKQKRKKKRDARKKRVKK